LVKILFILFLVYNSLFSEKIPEIGAFTNSRIIIQRWSNQSPEYSMIPKVYLIKILLKNTAN